ncbi:hypothetical protein ACFUTV_21600 [Streptomyces sp. NPDC057298]|uniref:hypothetical protein n=1 Tax=Streptomyces sp. NPDC057298 TaxID=3346091 RepID=UPI00363A5128
MAERLAAASDGLGVVGTGNRYCGKHCRQCHEQAEYGFTHGVSSCGCGKFGAA